MIQLEENDIVLCTVKRIEGTTVFLDVEDSTKMQGTMIFSEVSPGRIRNIRDYVVVNKKIVCKILRIKNGYPELSLRRVTAKEREEVLDRHKKEKILANMIKPILKEKTIQVLEKIKEKNDLADFLDEARENPKIIRKFVPAKHAPELEKIFSTSKTEKEKEVKEKITVTSQSPSGLADIKKTLDTKDAEIYYLGSSKFSISAKGKDYKTVNALLEEIITKIKERAKKFNVKVETKEK